MRLLLTASLSVLSFGSLALACSCASSGGCLGLDGKTGPVFLGTVLTVTDLPRSDDRVFLDSRKARIRIDESFGGLPPEATEVDVLTGRGGGDCGIPFRSGDVYLINAFVWKDGLLHASICGSTRKIDAAGAALRVLRQMRMGQRVPSLAGQIAQHDRNFEGNLGTHAPKPLANTLVRLKADGNVYETQSDAEGLYAFYGLPSGQYEFAPDLPSGTGLSWYIDSERPLTSFELHAGGCQVRNIEVFPSGSIQGRVLDLSNKPLPHAFVYIVPADQTALPAERRLYWTSQGTAGFFKFVHLPPGQYLILVNPDDSRNADFPYRRTFYPGVHHRASAAIITIYGGEQIKNADIQLEQQFAPRHLTVRVTWADGRLIRDFVFVKATPADNPAAIAHISQLDSKASVFGVLIVPDEPYKIEAELTCWYADERGIGAVAKLHSNQVYLGPKDERTDFSLTISAIACPENRRESPGDQ